MLASRQIYEAEIKNHENYRFIPSEHKINWVSVSKQGTNPRKCYWDEKHQELIASGNLHAQTKLVNVARYIHPTKQHTCKMCGNTCSIYYVYPTKNTWKWLKKEFTIEEEKHKTIFDIYNSIENPQKIQLFTKYFDMNIEMLQTASYSDNYTGNKLSPGVMANPPDRLDGFHCYNSICDCRSTKDKGRSMDNMKSYTRDRRAYEMLSDGRCLLANLVMGKLNTIKSTCFICKTESTMMTADHIGPITLGFIHDPVNFQACCGLCNSSKNNRIKQEDIQKIKLLEDHGHVMTSWWATNCWNNYKNTSASVVKQNLDRNAKKFLKILDWLKINKPNVLEEFIYVHYLNHDKSYTIDNISILNDDDTSRSGTITFQHTEFVSTKKTKNVQKERTIEILLGINKKNRRIKIDLTESEIAYLTNIEVSTFKNIICHVLQSVFV